MSTLEQQNRHAQLQAQMTVSLNALRAETAAKMVNLIEGMESRPRIPGAQSLPTLSGDDRLNKDESGAMVMNVAIGLPGVSGTIDTMIDVAEQCHDDRSRQMASKRPQDDNTLSIKQMASINEKNNQDLALFVTLGEELNVLDTYISSGYTRGAYKEGTLLPLENASEPELKPSEEYIVENQNNLNFKANAPAPKLAA